ncbi:MAG: thiol:disulfide interchange protein [Methylophilaceae bacterium]|nr:MAG: thiol:disulfide interchange protein [Methylophilaceae bacterium]
MSKRFSTLAFCFSTLLVLFVQLGFVGVSAAANSSGGGFSLFTEGVEEDEFLHPDEAFKLDVISIGNNAIEGRFTVTPGYYLYKERVSFEIKDATLGSITAVTLPVGDMKDDPNFGRQEVYHHDFVVNISTKNAAQDIVIHARFQGCSEKGLCYAPQLKKFNVAMLTTASTASETNITTNPIINGDDKATNLLKSGKLWLIAAGFFGFGLLLSFTPCVLPMIPILSGIIVGDKKTHHHKTSRLHSFNLSLAYVLGIALSYTIAGIAAGLSGQLLSNALQSPWMLGTTALIFVVLSFSMFGFYELKMPHSIEDRMVNTTNKLKGGQFFGVFVMGVISALIVSPCVAAPLAGALIYISQTRDVVLGGVALFALSIGMGVPLLLIGASAGHVLPKAGGWMDAVRNFFGILMLAVAIYIISPIIPVSAQMMLWAALLIIPAMYLHALDNLPLDSATGRSHPWMRFWKGIGIILLILGVTMLIGAVSGAKSPLQPLSGLSITNSQAEDHLPFVRVKNTAELDAQISAASGKVVMLDFYADWCTSCKEMELFTFSDPAVKRALKDVILLQADVTQNTAEDTALLNRFNLFGPPGIIFFNRTGQEIKTIKVIGYENSEKFLATVTRVNALKSDECNPLITC